MAQAAVRAVPDYVLHQQAAASRVDGALGRLRTLYVTVLLSGMLTCCGQGGAETAARSSPVCESHLHLVLNDFASKGWWVVRPIEDDESDVHWRGHMEATGIACARDWGVEILWLSLERSVHLPGEVAEPTEATSPVGQIEKISEACLLQRRDGSHWYDGASADAGALVVLLCAARVAKLPDVAHRLQVELLEAARESRNAGGEWQRHLAEEEYRGLLYLAGCPIVPASYVRLRLKSWRAAYQRWSDHLAAATLASALEVDVQDSTRLPPDAPDDLLVAAMAGSARARVLARYEGPLLLRRDWALESVPPADLLLLRGRSVVPALARGLLDRRATRCVVADARRYGGSRPVAVRELCLLVLEDICSRSFFGDAAMPPSAEDVESATSAAVEWCRRSGVSLR